MEGRFFMGIDPGANGAICVVDDEGKIVEIYRMPATIAELKEALDSWTDTAWHRNITHCVIERVQGMTGQSASAAFNFGRNYGTLEATVYMKAIPYETVTPQKWQQYFQAGKSKDFATKTLWKSHLWMMAKKLYPLKNIPKYAADAVLLARYCWERFK